MITTLAFDFGGVIMNLTKKKTINAPVALAELSGLSIETVLPIWKEFGDKLLTNQIQPLEFIKLFSAKHGIQRSPQELLEKWNELHLKEDNLIDWELLEYIQKLRSTYKVYILSNTFDVGMHGSIDAKLPDLFDGIFLSYIEGVAKPDREAFLSFCRKTHIRPDECILIDDNMPNIESARSVGMQTIYFTDFQSFNKALNLLTQ